MTALTGRVTASKADLLRINNDNAGTGVTGSFQTVYDGAGNATGYKVSTAGIQSGNIQVTANTITTSSGALTINSFTTALNLGTASGSTVIVGNTTGTTTINGTVTFGGSISFTNVSISGTATIGTTTTTSLTVNGKAISLGGALTTSAAVSITGAFTTAAAFTTVGNYALTLTQTGATNVTLPTTGTLSTLDGSETFTNKILTSPVLNTPKVGTSVNDTNGNELFKVTATGSAVNEFTIANATTATNPVLSATGGDTDIGLNFQSKGTGNYTFLGTATTQAALVLREQTTNGTNSIIVYAPASIASDKNVFFKDATGYIALDSTNSDAWTAFTPGFTGFSANPASPTAYYKKIGKTCFINIVTSLGTSNATTFTITGLPFTCNNTVYFTCQSQTTSTISYTGGSMSSGTTVLTMSAPNGVSNGWTASGNKGAWISMFYETT